MKDILPRRRVTSDKGLVFVRNSRQLGTILSTSDKRTEQRIQ